MNHVRNTARLFSTLAAVAVCVCAMLPAGLLPRVAGPCGRALCECRVNEAADIDAAVSPVLTFGVESIHGAAPAQLAFQLVLTGIEVLPAAAVSIPSSGDFAAAPVSPEFALLDVSSQVSTPPPRA